jgi:nuclear pore complex protein Nup155
MFSLLLGRGDLAYFDGLSETILAVGLVKPKAGKK